ncbi:uncharacterized protein LOC26526647 [Drosophila erecta]|uniref:Uncharacterized protein n=1 Tax=Drosophila erecta TaxID=7220 RepID=A0A0Q5T215_DROER|nr:uncharacterized protein LOC26526647 [Drosophila erecta]KQS25941.1 uncharacterized protein Dere_GG26823 [Drosophila erecta]
MSSRVPIFVVLILVIILITETRSEQQSAETNLEGGNQQLQLILDTINQYERQRLKEMNVNSNWDTIKQRPNSKRLRWNRKTTIPNRKDQNMEHRAFVTSTSSAQQQTNPDYINVNNYLPTPAPWWYN